MSEITAIWEQIEAWYEEQGASHLLLPPAQESEIDDLEAQLGRPLIRKWRESMLIHAGIKDSPVQELLSPVRIIEEWNLWMENVKQDHFPVSTDEQIARGWNIEAWVPKTWDFGSDGFYVDLSPAQTFRHGQIFYLDHEEGPQLNLEGQRSQVFSSFTGFLEYIYSELQAGTFNPEEAVLFN